MVIAMGSSNFFSNLGLGNHFNSKDDLIIKLFILTIISFILSSFFLILSNGIRKIIQKKQKNKLIFAKSDFHFMVLLSCFFIHLILTAVLFTIDSKFCILANILIITVILITLLYNKLQKLKQVKTKYLFLNNVLNFVITNNSLFYQTFAEFFRILIVLSIIISYFFFDLQDGFYLIVCLIIANQMRGNINRFLNTVLVIKGVSNNNRTDLQINDI